MHWRAVETGIAIAAAMAAVGAALFVADRGSLAQRQRGEAAFASTGGDPARGKAIIAAVGCGACHEIPGVRGARGRVGPSLAFFSARAFIAGVAPNTGDNLALWLQNPRAVDPMTAMPDMGLNEAAARDVAAYLYAQ